MTLKKSPGVTVLSLLLPCLLLGLPAGCKTNQPTASALRRLQGTWEGFMAGNEAHGKITIMITGHSLHFHRDTNFWFETTFTLPAGTDPQQLHATIKGCAPAQDPSTTIGKVVFTIFKTEDGTLTLAGNQDNEGEIPKTFPSATIAGPIFRYDLKKVQPQKKNARSPKSKVTVGETSQPLPITGNAPALEPGRKHSAELAKFASGPDLLPVPIAFQNNSAGLRKVYWLDTNGERRLYRELKPGESYEPRTYLAHPWVVTHADGNALSLYYPDGQKRTVTLE